MGKNTTELSGKNFDGFIKKGVSVVDFWAVWCGPCKIMGPIFEETAAEMKGKTGFGKVNVDENYELASRYNVMSIPTMIFFKDGKEVDRVVGVVDKKDIVKRAKDI